MCGIAGYAGAKDAEKRERLVYRMTAELRRRGPDDHGIESWPLATLGHRRLSIFDVSPAGHQPMMTAKREVGIVFNGAIYNFRSLREELEAKGYAFSSRTDTEVLLNGYLEWGIEGLTDKIDGMFAFAIWDDRVKTLYMVRDRLGVKPLTFSAFENSIVFASSVRAVKAAIPIAELSAEGVLEYLEFGFLTDESSIYKSVEKVGAGEIVEWSAGTLKRRRYWEPPVSDEGSDLTFTEAVRETERLFLLAVEKRLQADVPVAALLSGGIDSSLVCWAIAELGSEVKAFTVGTPEDENDETAAAAGTAARLGISIEVLSLSKDRLPDVNSLISAFSEPFASSSALGMLSIAEMVSKEAKVLLTGDGGDDVFLGYPEHRHFHVSSRLARMSPHPILRLFDSGRSRLPGKGALKRASSFAGYVTRGLAAVAAARDGLPFYMQNEMLGERICPQDLGHRNLGSEIGGGRQLLGDFLRYDLKTRFVGEYLPKVDGSTMFHALEARAPFLDIDLWNFASALSPDIRLKGMRLKAILRDIAARRIGQRVAARRKQGFMVPAQRWLAREWRQDFIDAMTDSRLEREGLIDARRTLDAFAGVKPGSTAPRQFWFIYILELWLRFESDRHTG
ncbi:MAG TPA: asparagine synthase (glutamine-hydrolyzing) [Pyrinomonadaceae bacterium]|mgnify:CR=1 FL=1|nr:asparagine synthase (glutamine-hydrolyzing) [Pyrinomonadaceae bacterium]HMP66295.1 asparagine synthase (glutamine-hydrolyzing) [Pyrinomonadaceae bacterium]